VQHGVEWEDNRSKQGAFWVLIPNRFEYRELSKLLATMGFQYKAGQGYWIK